MKNKFLRKGLASLLTVALTMGIFLTDIVHVGNEIHSALAANYGTQTEEGTDTPHWSNSANPPASITNIPGIEVGSQTGRYSMENGTEGAVWMCIESSNPSPTGYTGTIFACSNTAVFTDSSGYIDALNGYTYSQIAVAGYNYGRRNDATWCYAHAILSHVLSGDDEWYSQLCNNIAGREALGNAAWAIASAASSVARNATFYVYRYSNVQNLISLTYSPRPQSGRVRLNKVDETGTGVIGAVIQFTTTSGADLSSLQVMSGASGGHDISNGVEFTTTGTTVEIRGLQPNNSYRIYEYSAPENYELANPRTVDFTTDGNGNPQVSGAGWNASTYTYTMTDTTVRRGSVSFTKVSQPSDGDIEKLQNATIEFRSVSGLDLSSASVQIGVGTLSEQTSQYIRFVTGPGTPDSIDITIGNLEPGQYYFTEVGVPTDHLPADDISVTVNADGTCSPSSVRMVDSETQRGPWGSLGLVKSWQGTPADAYRFWNSVERVSFSVYGGWDRGYLEQYFNQYVYIGGTGGTVGPAHAFAEGGLTQGVGSNTSAQVYWDFLTENGQYNGPVNQSDPSYYQHMDWAAGQYVRWGAGAAPRINYLPRDTYYIITETWTDGMFWQGDRAVFINTENANGWTEVSYNPATGRHEYAALYHVSDDGVTYLCDWNTFNHIRPLNVDPVGGTEHWEDNYYLDSFSLDNESLTAQLDVLKIDQSGNGVDGVRFEVHRDLDANTNDILARGSISGSAGMVNGYNAYNVNWDYTLLRRGDFMYWCNVNGMGDDGRIGGYIYASNGNWSYGDLRGYRYNLRDFEWPINMGGPNEHYIGMQNEYSLDDFLRIYDDYTAHPENYTNDTDFGWGQQVPTAGGLNDTYRMIPAYFLQNFNRDTLNMNEENHTNENVVAMNYGTYYVCEYIEDANGRNIISQYSTPDGWTLSADGTYFYKPVTLNASNHTEALTVEIANRIRGSIDLSKVSLTGGPLSDLSFEILNSNNTVIATGIIPTGATPETTGTGTATDYTYSATWNSAAGSTATYTNAEEAITGLGTFTIREYIPTSALNDVNDLTVSGWTYGGTTTHNGVNCYYFTKTVVIDDSNAEITQVVTATNEIHPIIGTTLTDFADRHITVVGENIEFTDVVSYEGAYIGGSYVMHSTLMDAASGQPVRDEDGNVYEADVPFTANAGSGTVNVTFTVNTADLVEATQDANGVVSYSPRAVVCFESMRLVGDYEIANHNDLTDQSQTVEIPNPEIGTTFYDLQTQEHQVPAGRIVEVVDTVSYTNLHVGETYSLTCFLYDKTTGDQLMYSDNTPVVGRLEFVPQTESGTVDVTFTIDTSDLIVNVFAYDEGHLVAFEYLRSASGILIGGHTEIDDLDQYNWVPTPPPPRTLLLDDQTGTHEGVIGSAVPMTDTLWFEGLNIGESYQIRGSIVDRDNPNIVYATVVQDFVAQARNDSIQIHYTVDTSRVCEGNREAYLVCFEEIWQLDTQNTGRGEVMLTRHADVHDQDQSIHLVPEIHTTMNDVVTNSHYGMIGEDVVLEDTVAYYNLHIGETYTVTGVLMDKQTGLPVMQNGQSVTSTTTFVAPTQDGSVVVTYHVNTLELINQIGQTVNGITITAPREIVSFETMTSTSHYDFAIHADINDEGQTIICGDISSGAGDAQTSTSWLASGLTTVHDNVHYRGLGPVEYTLRGSLHLVDYDANGNPVDGGPIQARPGEVVSLEHTWTPSYHEGDIGFDFKLDSDRFQGRNIVVFEELWYNGVCIISHENYSDSMGNYGMANTEQTVHVASVWTSAFSFQSGEQLLAYDTEAKVTDFVYYGNVEVGQDYYCEASLWACYTDEAGQIHSVAISQADGGVATSPVFRATENHGIAEVTFTIDSTKLFDEHYDYLLVTERLIHVGSGVCIATHSDLTSKEQSINIPDLHTTASTATGNTLPEGENPDIMPVTVTDRVYYENLICDGRSYTVVGNLQYARTDAEGNITESGALVQNGQPVTASKTFVPESSTGYVDLEFTVNAFDIMAKGYDRIVAFEDLYFGPEGIRVGIHADITDSEQTVYVPDMHTTALGMNGRHNVAATANTVINDTIEYSGLTPGREYRIETDLMSSKTGASIAHVSTVFVPTEANGTITVSMTADLTGYGAGDKVVVFENCYDNSTGILIKSHMDWDDDDQTVTTGGGGDTGIMDGNSNRFLYAAIACFAAFVGLGGYTMSQKRRRKNEGSSDGVEG